MGPQPHEEHHGEGGRPQAEENKADRPQGFRVAAPEEGGGGVPHGEADRVARGRNDRELAIVFARH